MSQDNAPLLSRQLAGLGLFETPAETRREAQESLCERIERLRSAVLAALWDGPATADELASRIGASVLATRPRVSELYRAGLVRPTGRRRPNDSGKNAAEWERV